MVSTDRVLVDTIRARLAAEADPVRAPQTQAYMKSEMPYLGVPLPRVRAIVRAEAAERPPATVADLTATVRELWRPAIYREERYAATELTGLIERSEVTDPGGAAAVPGDDCHRRLVGSRRRGGAPDRRAPAGLSFADAADHRSPGHVDPDRWLRRTSIICQLDAKDRTDLTLLVDDDRWRTPTTPTSSCARPSAGRCASTPAVDPDWVRALRRRP